ncbi:MAG: GNAT family N-acetyltransferase [Oscillospiraceae bacterium]|jgi:AcrR family transcriptional regulator|nr:GNAT family N-acetyltransferase [Oscillospiraceae bacterium]MDD3260321.1 GNAT family N-acetyltransferase [Oscillospiraceae bacterium]
MGRKAGMEGNKREDILAAAQSCFMEQGFDGASVRAIMKQAGAEIGLFYYYFKNKDDAFDQVLDRFFAGYEADFARIVKHGRRNPCRVMQDFFEYMERETAAFREKYADKMHRTVRWAIREHTLTLIEPYLKQVVEIQSDYYGVQPPLAPQVAALYLTHGVGSAILHEDRETYFENRSEIKRGVSLLMGMPLEQQALRIPERATAQAIPAWMALVSATREHFPGLNEAEYEKQLAERIERGEAWLFRSGEEIAAALLYSRERRELYFLAVSPEYRRRGLAQKLVETAAAQLPVGAELSVVTYREGDPTGAEARAFYKAMGFAPAEELTAFDYPCQRLTVTVPDAPLGR